MAVKVCLVSPKYKGVKEQNAREIVTDDVGAIATSCTADQKHFLEAKGNILLDSTSFLNHCNYIYIYIWRPSCELAIQALVLEL